MEHKVKGVEILNDTHEHLKGIFEESHDSLQKNKLVIFCHGFLGHKNNCFFPELSKQINEAGYSTFRFDFSGYGESEGKFEKNTMSKNVSDLHSVCNYFSEKGYDVFCIIGHSLGASEVLVNQSKWGDAKCVVAIAPRVYGENGISERYTKEQFDELYDKGFFIYQLGEHSYKISKDYMDDRIGNFSDIRKKCKTIDSPVLIVHGEADTTTLLDESKDLIKFLNKHSILKTIPEEDHNFSNPEYQKVMFDTIITFLAWVSRGRF